jgi:coenzyme F420-reducing hydrogenase delta subunit/ferredoxin
VRSLFDEAFGAACNPWRQLGALAWWLFWVTAVTGIYVYVAFDTRADGAYASVARISANALPAGGIARSLHRYASDAFLLVVVLHLAREAIRGRYAHFRRYSWITGIVALWLVFFSGLGGFWLVWDRLAQYSFAATLEWLNVLGGGALARNALVPDAVTDRLFSLLVFLHIGLPLALLLVMGIHVKRVASPATRPPRTLASGTLAALVALCVVAPVRSDAMADVLAAASALRLDWFYLSPHVLADATSPATLWVVALGATLALLALPWLHRTPRAPAAQVAPDRCNGCGRCFADCPYVAVTLVPRSDGRAGQQVAVVDADLCAACGICVGACPSSTPFGRVRDAGIDLPQAPLAKLRAEVETALVRLRAAAHPRIVVFGCASAQLRALADACTATIPLVCAGQLPPPLVEYALRAGADGVLVTGCREGDCDFRLGNRWTDARVAGVREPRLRVTVSPRRVRLAWIGRGSERALRTELRQFRESLMEEATHDRPGR